MKSDHLRKAIKAANGLATQTAQAEALIAIAETLDALLTPDRPTPPPDYKVAPHGFTFTHEMEGPIAVGDWYIWEPLRPHSTSVFKVSEIVSDKRDELAVCLVDMATSVMCWVDEGRLREACVRIPINTFEE